MKEKTKIILTIIITFIVTLGITVTAALVTNATNITYTSDKTEKTNVNEALDELYDMASNAPSVYGVRRLINNSETAWERLGLSIDKNANATKDGSAVVNDFDNIYPWSDIKSYNYDTSTQTITAWYGDDEFTFTPTDDTTEVLTYIPDFYYSRTQSNGYEYIMISDKPLKGFTKSGSFSVGRYTMSGSSTRIHSRSGNAPLVNHTITEFRTYARNLGSGFGQLDYHYFILQLLYLVEYADYNSQEKLGLGNTNNTQALASGGCNTLGMKSGTLNNDGKHSVIYRGIEDIYGNIWQFVDGINIKDYQAYINYNPATYQSDKFDGDYKRIGYLNSNVTYGNISKLGYDVNNQVVALPIETNGSEITYITDGYHGRSIENGTALVGGRYGLGAHSGLWFWHLAVDSSITGELDSARLLKIN